MKLIDAGKIVPLSIVKKVESRLCCPWAMTGECPYQALVAELADKLILLEEKTSR